MIGDRGSANVVSVWEIHEYASTVRISQRLVNNCLATRKRSSRLDKHSWCPAYSRESQRLIKILQAKSKQHFCGGSVLSAEVVAVLMGLASWLRASADSADGHRFESRRTPLFATLTKIVFYSDLFSLDENNHYTCYLLSHEPHPASTATNSHLTTLLPPLDGSRWPGETSSWSCTWSHWPTWGIIQPLLSNISVLNWKLPVRFLQKFTCFLPLKKGNAALFKQTRPGLTHYAW